MELSLSELKSKCGSVVTSYILAGGRCHTGIYMAFEPKKESFPDPRGVKSCSKPAIGAPVHCATRTGGLCAGQCHGEEGMEKGSEIEVVPEGSVDAARVARDWWSGADGRLLPGETGGVTVFVMDFADGCRFFGYTRSRVFDRVSALVTKRGTYAANAFVSDYAVQVPYVVKCVASGLGRGDAWELRDFLVLLGPSRSAGAGRSVVESACCWLVGDEAVGDSLPFSEFGSLNLNLPLGPWPKHEFP